MQRDQAIARLAAAIQTAVDSSPRGAGELARTLHVNERTLRRYRRGERVPTRSWLEDLERSCELEPGSLVTLLEAIPAAPAETEPAPEPIEPIALEPVAPEPVSDGPGGPAPRRWRALIAGAAAVCVAAIVVAIVMLTGGSSSTRVANLASAPSAHGKTFVEYADNHLGSPVFENTTGAAVVGAPPRIPFNTKVYVSCEAPNDDSGMTSVTAFYLVSGGRWNGHYVVSDTMSNGGPPGNTDTPNVDPRVPQCPQSG